MNAALSVVGSEHFQPPTSKWSNSPTRRCIASAASLSRGRQDSARRAPGRRANRAATSWFAAASVIKFCSSDTAFLVLAPLFDAAAAGRRTVSPEGHDSATVEPSHPYLANEGRACMIHRPASRQSEPFLHLPPARRALSVVQSHSLHVGNSRTGFLIEEMHSTGRDAKRNLIAW